MAPRASYAVGFSQHSAKLLPLTRQTGLLVPSDKKQEQKIPVSVWPWPLPGVREPCYRPRRLISGNTSSIATPSASAVPKAASRRCSS